MGFNVDSHLLYMGRHCININSGGLMFKLSQGMNNYALIMRKHGLLPYSYSLSFLAVNQSNGFHINKQSMRLSELCLLITNPHCNPMLGLSQLWQ